MQPQEVAAAAAFVMVIGRRSPHVADDNVQLSIAVNISNRNAATRIVLGVSNHGADVEVPAAYARVEGILLVPAYVGPGPKRGPVFGKFLETIVSKHQLAKLRPAIGMTLEKS